MISGSFIILLPATICGTISSFIMRKTMDFRGSVKGYLSVYFFLSFVFSSFLNSIFTSTLPEFKMPIIGSFTGILIISLMLTLGSALKKGPSGLSFAFLNSGAIGAPILLGLIFKKNFGFDLSFTKGLGMIFVMVGLFWASSKNSENKISKAWILFAFATFVIQSLILSVFQWKVLIVDENVPSHFCLPFHCKHEDELWFMPSMFFFAFVLQSLFFLIKEKRGFTKAEIIGGTLGGIANGVSTWLLLHASSIASLTEKTMLLPIFAVLLILLCSVCGRLLYSEPIHWLGNFCCIAGILIGTLF